MSLPVSVRGSRGASARSADPCGQEQHDRHVEWIAQLRADAVEGVPCVADRTWRRGELAADGTGSTVARESLARAFERFAADRAGVGDPRVIGRGVEAEATAGAFEI